MSIRCVLCIHEHCVENSWTSSCVYMNILLRQGQICIFAYNKICKKSYRPYSAFSDSTGPAVQICVLRALRDSPFSK